MNPLAALLLDAGLIQFGWFRRDGALFPFALDLDMLASYPAGLQTVTDAAHNALGGVGATRLLCSVEALPFGVAYALRSGIPLVYSRNSGEPLVFDLVGAYDIGHQTLLLTNTLDGSLPGLIAGARRVGLDVHTVITILELRPVTAAEGVKVVPLLTLADLVREAARAGRLAAGHAEAVRDWIADSGENLLKSSEVI